MVTPTKSIRETDGEDEDEEDMQLDADGETDDGSLEDDADLVDESPIQGVRGGRAAVPVVSFILSKTVLGSRS